MKTLATVVLAALLSCDVWASDAAFFFGRLESGELEQATRMTEKLASGDPTLRLYLEAQIEFFRQRYDRSLEKLSAIPKSSRLASEIGTFSKLVEETRRVTAPLERMEVEGFTFRFASGPDALLPLYAASALETARKRLSEDLAVSPSEKLTVDFYPSWRDFIAVSTLTESEVRTTGTVALCKFNRLMVTTPRALLFGYDWLDTVVHEYSHQMINRATRGRAPVWLHEGLAKYEEVRWRMPGGSELPREQRALLRKRLDAGSWIPFEKMHPSLAKLKTSEDAAVAFAEVFFFVKYVVEKRGGWPVIQKVLSDISRGADASAAFAGTLGTSFAALEKEWRAWLDQEDLPRDPGVRSQPIELRDADAPDTEGSHAYQTLSSEAARQSIRLGDLLADRKRYGAALMEYAKGEKGARELPPFFFHRVADAAQAVGKTEEALRALARAEAIQSEHPGTFVRRAEIFQARGRWAEAETEFLRANAVQPFDPRIHLGLLEIYRAHHRPREREREEAALRALSARK